MDYVSPKGKIVYDHMREMLKNSDSRMFLISRDHLEVLLDEIQGLDIVLFEEEWMDGDTG